MECSTCSEEKSCKIIGDGKCPRAIGREIPFSVLSSADNIVDIAQPSSAIFCSSPDHSFKRSARAKVAISGLNLESIAALTLLSSTDYPFSILEVSEVVGLSERQLYYLKTKVRISVTFCST